MRADAYRGFQEMNASANMAGWSKYDPKTGRTATPQSGRSTPTAQYMGSSGTRPKSAFEHVNSRPNPAAFGRSQSTKKKQGFAPATPGGDEPMARNISSYNSTPRAERMSAFFESAPTSSDKKTSASSRPQTPQEEFAIPELSRQSHRYATTGGERTYFSSAEIGRSTSRRESSSSTRPRSRTNPPSPSSSASSRHHRASPEFKTRTNRSFSLSSSSIGNSDSESDSNGEDARFEAKKASDPLKSRPKAVPKSRLRNRMPKDKDTAFVFHGPGYGEEYLPESEYPFPFRQRPSHSRPRYRRDRSRNYQLFTDSSTDSDYYQGHDSDSASFTFRSPKVMDWEKAKESTPGRAETPNFAYVEKSKDRVAHVNLTWSRFGATPAQKQKSRSHDNLNSRFSASEWNEVFKNPDLFVPQTAGKHRDRTSKQADSTLRPHVSSSTDDATRQQQSRTMPESTGPPEPNARVENLQDVTSKLSNLDTGKEHATVNGTNVAGKASQAAPQKQATVSTEAEEEARTIPNMDANVSGGPDAMDIDDEPVTTAAPNVPSNTGGPTPKPEQGASSHAPPKAANSDAGDHLNLKNLDNVAPFTSTNNSGINDLQDIHTSLPFLSRAANPNTGRRPTRSKNLDLPQPPKRPRRPPLVPAGGNPRNMVLPQKSWDRYVAEMSAYMGEWNQFQRQMLQIFNARQDATETGLNPRWVSAFGDSTRLNIKSSDGGAPGVGAGNGDDDEDDEDILIPGYPHGGYNALLRSIEEHARIREHWDVAWERHRACILELGELRNWLRSGGKTV